VLAFSHPSQSPTLLQLVGDVAQAQGFQRRPGGISGGCVPALQLVEQGFEFLEFVPVQRSIGIAILSMAENLPPKLLRVNQPIGKNCTPMPCNSVLPPAAGTSVPQRGEVIIVTTLAGLSSSKRGISDQ